MSQSISRPPIDWKYSLIAIGVFLFSSYLLDILKFTGILANQGIPTIQFWTVIMIGYLIVPIIVFMFLFGLRDGLKQTGLFENPLKALVLGLLFTSPLWIGFAFLSEQPVQFDLGKLTTKAIIPGITEEVMFRGFLFGLLLRHAKWNFIFAAGIAAVFFGIGHWYQGVNLISSLMIFAITFIGSAWFSWLYLKWGFNLWVPIFVHILMNAAWFVFNVDASAMGNLNSNLLRVATILLSIFVTIYLRRPNKGH